MFNFENLDLLQNTIQTYLNKFSSTTKLIDEPVEKGMKLIVVIPSYCEPELEKVLISLCQCEETRFPVEVIAILNSSDKDLTAISFHADQINQLRLKYQKKGNISFHFGEVLLEPKKAGVGMARKAGMDEAVRRFAQIDFDGMIVCLDADCKVSANYLRELEKLAHLPGQYESVCIHFQHHLDEQDEDKLNLGIVYYELFLRYYKESLRYCGFPYAFHTVGSSMAVKCSAYCRSGGMNQRKAGEDFYFLHKVFHYGRVIELNAATVFPSSRISDRVPFGTGRSQMNYLKSDGDLFMTYDFRIFEDLKQMLLHDFCQASPLDLPASAMKFLHDNEFDLKIEEIRKHTASEKQFRKRFFNWMDGFMVLKFVHETRDHFYPNIPIENALKNCFRKLGLPAYNDLMGALHILRNMQKNSGDY